MGPRRERDFRPIICEMLEPRRLFQAFTPSQIEAAYGFNQISFNNGAVPGNGAGQTIALIETDDDPTILPDLQNFDSAYGLPDPTPASSPTGWHLSVVGENGGAVPTTAASGSPLLETALDVEWAHAIAPAANILVVEADSPYDSDLYPATQYAAAAPGVSVVSISYTRSEENTDPGDDYVYTTPANHNGVTFVAAAGDHAGASHPASSANVVGVGGTTLTLNADNTYNSESYWHNTFGAGGGGKSAYEPEPAYQEVAQQTGYRTMPDVAYDADPNTGFYIYVGDSTTPEVVGGTSAGAPQWAALFAIADQGRALNGLGSLDGPSQTLPMLYDLYGTPLYSQAFHDITTGGFGLHQTGPGYDETTGLGSPQANVLVQYLAGNITSVPEPASEALAILATAALLKKRKSRLCRD